jgi:hypothetical protein
LNLLAADRGRLPRDAADEIARGVVPADDQSRMDHTINALLATAR